MSQGSGMTGGPDNEPDQTAAGASRDDGTRALPPRLIPKPVLNPVNRKMPGWLVGIFAVLALVVIAVPSILYAQIGTGQNTGTTPATCDTTTSPCQAAQAYLSAYTSANYEAMYKLVSSASTTRFSDKAILGGNYHDAHEYIVSRTAAILNQAEAYTITATTSAVRSTDAAHATVPAHVVMHTIRVGTITQDIALPLVLEKGQWRVDWSPGLIFAPLNDAADPQFQRLVRLCAAAAPRGRILAGDGSVLADDETVYAISIVPGKIANASALNQALASALDFSPDQIAALYKGADPNTTVSVRTIAQSLYSQVSASLTPLVGKGVEIDQTTGRVYPYGADLAAMTGYVQQVSNQDLLNDPGHYYELGDDIGRAGVEQWAEQQLRPGKGGELDIVPPNNGGGCDQAAYTIARQTALAGNDVHSTINVKLQQTAMARMRKENKSSGAVALDPSDGAVLVLASNPMYNPNDFSLGFTPNESARFNALDHPYLNRAVSGTYPIGSVFKIITLAAALEHGTALTDKIDCTGSFQLPGVDHAFIDDLPTGHGTITIYQGLAASCDVVFWTLAERLNQKDPNILPTMARNFGYGTLTHIVGLPNGEEQAGVVPDPAYVHQVTGGSWSAVDALNLAIGQGYFLATPLQLADVSAEVGNGGVRWQPRLVSSVTTSGGTTAASYPPTKLADLIGDKDLTADHLAMLQTAMLGPTTNILGTAYYDFNNFPILVAGKTGTSQTSTPLPDALFTCYAPASPANGPPVAPKIAVGAIVEYSGFGEAFSVPIAKDLMLAYLR
jgi:penicillin-binding protein 2